MNYVALTGVVALLFCTAGILVGMRAPEPFGRVVVLNGVAVFNVTLGLVVNSVAPAGTLTTIGAGVLVAGGVGIMLSTVPLWRRILSIAQRKRG